MTRNLKVLGLTFVAALAICAISASMASAKGSLTSAASPTTITGVAEGVDQFTTTAGIVNCPNAVYTGTMATSPTNSVTVTPSYGHCTAFGLPALIDINGCTYKFSIDPASAETKGWVDIVCPVGKEITVTANENTTNTLTTKCTVHVPPQTVGGIKYDNVGTTDKIKVTVNATGITYTETEGTGLGKCPKSNPLLKHDGTFTGTAIVSGSSAIHIG